MIASCHCTIDCTPVNDMYCQAVIDSRAVFTDTPLWLHSFTHLFMASCKAVIDGMPAIVCQAVINGMNLLPRLSHVVVIKTMQLHLTFECPHVTLLLWKPRILGP